MKASTLYISLLFAFGSAAPHPHPFCLLTSCQPPASLWVPCPWRLGVWLLGANFGSISQFNTWALQQDMLTLPHSDQPWSLLIGPQGSASYSTTASWDEQGHRPTPEQTPWKAPLMPVNRSRAFWRKEADRERRGDSRPLAMLISLPPVSSPGVVRYTNWSSQPWLQMVLELNSSHTSSQANEPLLCPLFNMDVTPAGYSLTHCENYFSIKMQELELCPERAAKNTALWVLVTGN